MVKMKVLLVNPSAGYFNSAVFNPLGLLAIGSYLKSIGIEVKLIDRCVEKINIKKEISNFNPDVVGIGVMSARSIKDGIYVSKIAKKSECSVVWGGAMPSMQAEIVLKEDFVDYVIIGEGEYTFRDLLLVLKGELALDECPGIAYKNQNQIIFTKQREFIDLSELPITDYSLINVEKYLIPYLGCEKLMYIYSSKGCPCRCSFCVNHCFHKSTHRKRPNDIVIREIKYLIENYGMDGVYFSDELWCADKREMYDFCKRVKEEDLHFSWFILTRVGLFSKEDFQLMYECGCRGALFGIETGSREMMKKIHKNINYDLIVPSFSEIKNIGITNIASFIIGYPGETVEQLKDTVDLIQRLDVHLTPIFHLTPLPGTEIYEEVVKQGVFNPPKTLKECSKDVPTITVGTNLSNVPTTDLRVIRSSFIWKSFTNKDGIENKGPFTFAKDTILSGLRAISQKGVLHFFVDGFSAFNEFVYIFWYSHAYPMIKKKYGLR